MNVLVVGSIAFDTIETPFEKVQQTLGGSAIYFSTACSFFSKVNVVAVVGEDFKMENLEFLKNKGVDFKGIKQEKGKTFRWHGKYHNNFNERDDLETKLNVFENFNPVIPDEYKKCRFLFLANIHPELQLDVLNQIEKPEFVALDTIKYYIDNNRDDLIKVLKNVNAVFLNDSEIRNLTGEHNLITAAIKTIELGPEVIIIKKGEHGALLISRDLFFSVPGYPVEEIKDPTGAGDSFAGGFMGYISKVKNTDNNSLKRAVVYGNILGSFCVEKIGVKKLKEINFTDIKERFRKFREYVSFN